MNTSLRPSLSAMLLCAFFVFGGVMHFVKPGMYVRIMPPWLPAPMALVLISGVFEIMGGLGVLHPATRWLAGWGLIALLIAVYPANIQMLLNAYAGNASTLWKAALWARLPLQIALIWWVHRSAVRAS